MEGSMLTNDCFEKETKKFSKSEILRELLQQRQELLTTGLSGLEMAPINLTQS